ncbi:permease [Eubacteriaceae bacterium ES3]|nr:permease [Eubacteriaceae bacterium ES3]
MKNEKEIVLTLLKNKVFYIALVMLATLFILDALGIKIGVAAVNSEAGLGLSALSSAGFQFVSMLKIVPPIFLMIGLLDIWVPKETMIRFMGEKSGVVGILVAFFIGAMSAGPLVAAFPVAQIMLKKGARYSNVLFFLSIWASAKLPILFFQATALGVSYTVITNITLITVYLVGTLIIERMLSAQDKDYIYSLAEQGL